MSNKTQTIVDWNAIRAKADSLSDTEKQVIERCFAQMANGNSFFKEMLDDPQLTGYISAFQEGWIMHELFVKGK